MSHASRHLPPRYLPILLDIRGRRCVVVGGGHTARQKVQDLLAAQASVTVISPELAPGLQELHRQGAFAWLQRPYQAGDLEGCFLAFTCAGDEEANAAAAEEAMARSVLLNAADKPERGHFIVPATHRQGALTFTVSTDGKSPALARVLRDELAQTYDHLYAALLDVLAGLRPRLRQAGVPAERRAEFYRRLLDTDWRHRLEQGDRDGVRRQAEAMLAEYTAGEGTDAVGKG